MNFMKPSNPESSAHEIARAIRESIERQMRAEELDRIEVVPIPASGDRMVRLRTLQEVLDSFEDGLSPSADSGSPVGYLVQIRPRKAQAAPPPPLEGLGLEQNPSMYLPNGKLNVPFLLKNAELLFLSGDYPLARNIYKAVAASGEKTASALFGIGRCYEAEGKKEEARLQYEESLAYQPDLEAYRQLASLLVRMGKEQQAAETMERALLLKELSSTARFELHQACGNCWMRAQKAQSAEKHYSKAIEIRPEAHEIRANLGALYLQSGKTQEARRCFEQALASNPKNHKALTGLASCHLADGDKRSAHDFFAKALDIELNNPVAVFHLVKCAYDLKTYATATRILEEYVQVAPVNAGLLYSLAGLQFHLGRIADTCATTRKILELVPGHSGAQELLAAAEKLQGPAQPGRF